MMAVARAACTCVQCGATFTRLKEGLKDKKQAESWEKWAAENITLCDKCYDLTRPVENRRTGLYALVREVPEDPDKTAVIFCGNTYAHKDEIKGVGKAVWTDEYPQADGTMKADKKHWVVTIAADEADDVLAKCEAIGAQVDYDAADMPF